MQKIALGLSALLLIAAIARTGLAQDPITAAAAVRQTECAESSGCLLQGTLAGAQAGAPRGSPQLAQARAGAVPDGAPPAAQPTWKDEPSLMDSSWRKWPSLTDF
jgi:hypothetical protein